MRLKHLILAIGSTLFVSITQILILINLFPQTGLARIVYIPFYLIFASFFTHWIVKKLSHRKRLCAWMLLQIVLFHFYLWTWPQVAGYKKGLIQAFYSLF